jgi:long-chain acyl-CoA synthetase
VTTPIAPDPELKPETLAEIIRGHTDRRPDSVALDFPGDTVDYKALNEAANRVGHGLLSLGVHESDRVAYLGKTSREYFELLFGAGKINAVPVPINHRLAPREIGLILSDAEASVLVVGPQFTDIIDAVTAAAPTVRDVIVLQDSGAHVAYSAWIGQQPSADPAGSGSGADIALQVYTSGTTGQPKGVMISGSALIELLITLSRVTRIGRDSVTMSSLPMFHIGGNAWALAGLLKGCQSVLLPDTVPSEMLRTIARLRVTVAFAVPAVVQALLDAPELAEADCSSLETLYYGGSPITETTLRRALDVFECDFVQGFGLSECGLVTALQPEDHDPERRPELLRSCGRALAPNEVRLVDPATRQDVASGTVGELWVRSPIVMSGYYKKPEETAAALTTDGWLRTGDAARIDEEGYYFLADRMKDMIISGGENVYSAEVENTLMFYEGIKECAVIGVPSKRWGETVKAIVAVDGTASADEKAIIAFCRQRLAHYKCPTSVEFVDSLPRNASGKVVKTELRERFVADVHP